MPLTPQTLTNKLYQILDNIRQHLLDRGCVIQFGAKVERLEIEDGALRGVRLQDGQELAGSPVILATGHSARKV